MNGDHPTSPDAVEEEFSAAAPPHPAAVGAGETSFGDAEAPAASEQQLELVHSARHVRGIRELCEAGGGAIDADTFVGEASFRAALHAAGGACEMVRALLAGESVDEVAFLLGRRDANVTRAVYVRELSDARRRTMRRSRMVAEFGDLLRAQNGD